MPRVGDLILFKRSRQAYMGDSVGIVYSMEKEKILNKLEIWPMIFWPSGETSCLVFDYKNWIRSDIEVIE